MGLETPRIFSGFAEASPIKGATRAAKTRVACIAARVICGVKGKEES